MRPGTQDSGQSSWLGFKIFAGLGRKGGSLLPLALPERSCLMELLLWEWREPEQEEVTSLCRLDAHPTPAASGPQSEGWELHCLCYQKTYVIIFPGWTRDAQKVSVCLQLSIQVGMSDCASGVGGVACTSGK